MDLIEKKKTGKKKNYISPKYVRFNPFITKVFYICHPILPRLVSKLKKNCTCMLQFSVPNSGIEVIIKC